MRKLVLVVGSLLLCLNLSAAADKISSQWKCDGKPSDQHSIAVPEQPGHSYAIAQGKCTSIKGAMGDAKETEGTFTEFDDVKGNAISNHGVFVATLSTGDKVFYNYHGSQTLKDGKMTSASNTWTLGGGTGKLKGVKGSGGCKGNGNADGSSTWHCDGTYSTGK
ncbi:MAG TPA: hypothetical protein VGR50_07495 [Terriglobales bacterium]|nr:hypothetical protein [Terriglobales bacterium]